MQKVIHKILQIYPEEGSKSFSFLRLTFFWAFGITILETLSDGLFLEKVGSKFLPEVFVATAIIMIGASMLLLYGFRFGKPCKILKTTFAITAFLCLGASFLLFFNLTAWFWCVLKISSKTLFSTLFAFVWTFIDQYHDLQNAKRVYALYSALFFVGNILAGTMINLAFNYFHPSGLLITAAVSLFFALSEVNRISFIPPLHAVDSFKRESLSPLGLVRSLFQSPFTICLLVLSLITQLIIIVSEYSYMDSFARMFEGVHSSGNVEGAIAEFLGKCKAWIAGCNILIGIFFYGRFIERLGLNNVMLASPLFFLMVYSEWAMYDTLLIAIFGLVAVDGVRFTIEDNCFNLLSKAVPQNLKPKVRLINDSFFEPIGMLFGSLLLCGLQSGSRLIGLILSALALVAALTLRELYHKRKINC